MGAQQGHRFNPNRLLLDPYAKATVGRFDWSGANLVDRADPLRFDPRDTAAIVPKGVVVAHGRTPPLGPPRAWSDTVVYEAHVRGLTMRASAGARRRCAAPISGLAQPAVLEHLVRLGVTTVELMPVWAFLDELRLVRLGLRNYWGYNPYSFMAPEPRYAVADPAAEFRAMVDALHGAGIEVVLDVVLNHTAETDQLGPTLSLRGLDNATYYRLDPHDPSRYLDWAGCGNSLNLGHPRVLQLAMDALRHWADLGVDGFRFDLAPALGRDLAGGFRTDAALLQAIAQDPVLGRLKLIAEPWDLGPDGYRQGRFPPPFAMWNDRFRDCVRRFWRGDEGDPAGARRPPAWLRRPLRGRGPPALGQRQPRHQPRRVHARRPRQLCRAPQRGQRRAQSRRPPRQSERQSRRRGSDRRSGDRRPCAAASSSTSSPRCCSPRARRCC